MKRGLQYGALGLLLVLIAGLVAPFIRIDQYQEQIRGGLERALRRKVDIYGQTHLNLFRGPGFTVEKVVVHDDPSVGLEPLADVAELQASVSLSSLWTGKLEISGLRFLEPRVNIVKPDQGAWNIAPLLAGAAAQNAAAIPEIRLVDSRLNFKFGDMKSAFYLTEADLTLTPSRGGVDVRFSGSPARTDRAAGGYGMFSGRGRWANGRVDLDVELERSSIEELVTLARGQSLGLHGRIASRAKLSGPVGNVSIQGRFDLEDVHRWDLIEGRTGSMAMNYKGKLDFGAQRLEITADPSANANLPVAVRLVIADILYNPNWLAEVTLTRLPASAVAHVARHMGAPIPDTVALDGDALGVIAYGSTSGVQGQISLQNATVHIDNGPELKLPSASVLLSGDEIRLLPATLSGPSRAAQLEATYAPFRQHLEARITGRGLPITDLQDGPGHLLSGASVPLFDRFKGGTWSGAASYTSNPEEPGVWTADVHIENTAATVPGVTGPVRIASADLTMNGERVSVRRMRASAAKAEVYGDYEYDPTKDYPHRFTLAVPAMEASDLEDALAPTLRRSSNFFYRTLRIRSNAPEWLRTRRAEGLLRIGTLTAGEHIFRAVRAHIVWNGATVEMPQVEARLDEAAIATSATADLTRSEPRYRLRGSVRNLDWRGGRIDFEGTVQTAGTGVGVLANLTAAGQYEGRSLLLAPDLPVKSCSGTFDLTASSGTPQLKLSVAHALVGTDRYTGEGATQADGRFHMDLASGTHVMRLSGGVLPLKLEVSGERTAR